MEAHEETFEIQELFRIKEIKTKGLHFKCSEHLSLRVQTPTFKVVHTCHVS